jgi:exodeoxyribonuclease-5
MILNEGQERIRQQAVDWFYNSSEPVFEISGPPGTGKTVLIYEILKSLGLKPYQYMSMAYTGQASIVMRTRGFINARSIHSSLYECVEVYDKSSMSEVFGTPKKKTVFRLRQEIDPNICLFFIDEGYMVPKRMKKDILSFGRKVIVAGDQDQLPPIEDEPAFLTGYGVHRLTEIMRQAEDSAIIYIALRAIKGLPIHAGCYNNQVLVIDSDEITPDMIGFSDCICCGTNRTRETLNSQIRQMAGFGDSILPRYGERIICRNNNWQRVEADLALANGLCGTTLSQPDLSSYNKAGDIFFVDFKPDLADVVFPAVPINYKYFSATYEQKQQLKQMQMRNRMFLQGEMFEYAYALTTHLCQGSEYNKGMYIEEQLHPQMQKQLNYTGITRFKNGLIYVRKKSKYFSLV